MIFAIAQIFSVFGALFNVIGMFMKDKRVILIFLFIACICFSISTFLLGGISGGVVSLIQAFLVVVNYFLDKKEIKINCYLIIFYMFIALLCGVITYKSSIDFLPIICFLFFVFSIIQTKEINLKICMFFMFLLYAIYAFLINGYVLAFANFIQALMSFIAIAKLVKS